ncbi:hypothetical protein [Janibacter sp. GXQ6167]|uniref:hypothetical protein n=1 Tax=Janibacter sp. GXQ6167 TaxID=3240791 RepID=UPI003524A306
MASVALLAGCGTQDHPPESTAVALQQALSDHDRAALTQILVGSPDDAAAVIDASRAFTPSGEPVVAGHGDSSQIRCAWIPGTARGEDSYVVAQLQWRDDEGTWAVLPSFLPGGEAAKGASPCEGETPPEFAAKQRFGD